MNLPEYIEKAITQVALITVTDFAVGCLFSIRIKRAWLLLAKKRVDWRTKVALTTDWPW